MPTLNRNQWIGVVVALVVAILAFGSLFYFNSQPTQAPMNDSTNNQIATDTAATASSTGNVTTLANGLVIEDVVVGTGTDVAATGNTVQVAYTGKLENGTVFDSTDAHGGQPISFTLGAGQVIQGWEQGIAGMKVGGERILTIPPALGYGNQAVGGDLIPANSTLVFDVKLVGVTNQ